MIISLMSIEDIISQQTPLSPESWNLCATSSVVLPEPEVQDYSVDTSIHEDRASPLHFDWLWFSVVLFIWCWFSNISGHRFSSNNHDFTKRVVSYISTRNCIALVE